MSGVVTENEVLTVPQVAEYLGIGETKAWELVWRGEIPSFRIGKLVRVRRIELERWIEEREAENKRRIKQCQQKY